MAAMGGTVTEPESAEVSTRLTRERILAAAEEVMLRHGPDKATVVDVARVLGVNHANVYKFYAGKSDLRRALVEDWLQRMDAGLAEIVADTRAPPEVRVDRWLEAFVGARHRMWLEQPDLFLAFRTIGTEQTPEVWKIYKDKLFRSIGAIIAQGVDSGAFKVKDPMAAATAIVYAVTRFYHPVHHREWTDPTLVSGFIAVRRMLITALKHGDGA